MKKLTLLPFILLFSIILCKAQSITLYSKTSAEPLSYKSVAVKRGDNIIAYKSTDAAGHVDISNLSGDMTLVFYATGFSEKEISVVELVKGNGRVYLDEKSVVLDDFVISASKFAEPKRDAAMQIEIIKSADVANMNQPTTAEMLSNSGHVFVQKSQLGGGSPVMRGFEASRVLIVVDGVRMNNAIFRSGHLQNVLRIDQNILERTELVFGPGSVVYGSDALGGVLHFHTKSPIWATGDKEFEHIGNAFLRYGSAMNESTAHVDINMGSQKFGSLTSVNFSRFGDLMQGNIRQPALGNTWDRSFYVKRIDGHDSIVQNANPNKQVGSGYYQYDILQKFLIASKNSKIRHLINFQYSGSSNVNRYDRLTEVDGSGNPRSAEWYYGPEKRLLASYQMVFRAKPAFDEGRFIVGYQNIEESRHNRNYLSANKTSRIEKVHVVTANLDLMKEFKKNKLKHEIRYGLEGTFNFVKSTAFRTNVNDGTTSNTATTRYPDGGSKMYSAAAYASHTMEINNRWIISEGIRFNYVGLNASFNDTVNIQFPFNSATQQNYALNGNLGVIYMPGNDWRFSLLGSSGFRAPNVDDLSKVFDSQAGLVVVPNPAIKPEYSANVDVSISKTFYQRIRLQGTGYFTWLWNAISMQPFRFNGQDSIIYDGQLSQVMANQNSNRGFITGASFSIDADLTQYFAIESSIGYTYGRLRSGKTWSPLDHIPPLYGKIAAILKLKKFRGEFYTLFNGSKLLKNYSASGEDNLQYASMYGMPAWYTLNLRASYSINRYLRVQVGLENLLDARYRTFASGISAPGRNLTVTLRTRF